MSKSVKKQVDDAKENQLQDLDLSDKGIAKLHDIPGICEFFCSPTYSLSCALRLFFLD